jgi:pimeloyl-ACP methyl ester carboxylesterase
MYRRVMPALASSGLRSVALTQRGFSAGARPPEVSDYEISHLVDDVVAVLDVLGWSSAHLVGHDWGSVVAWEVAAYRPELVRSLTALSVPHPNAFGVALRDDPVQREKSEYMRFFASDPAKAAAVLLTDDAARLRALYGDAVHHDDVEHYLAAFREPGALEASLRWYAAIMPGLAEPTSPVDVPVTFVWGAEDIAIGETAALGCARWCLGDYDFRPLPGRGHWLVDQDPDAVVDAVLARVG